MDPNEIEKILKKYSDGHLELISDKDVVVWVLKRI
jgi:hypothetical protein